MNVKEGMHLRAGSHAPMFATDAIGKKYAGARGERSSNTVEASRETAATILLRQHEAITITRRAKSQS